MNLLKLYSFLPNFYSLPHYISHYCLVLWRYYTKFIIVIGIGKQTSNRRPLVDDRYDRVIRHASKGNYYTSKVNECFIWVWSVNLLLIWLFFSNLKHFGILYTFWICNGVSERFLNNISIIISVPISLLISHWTITSSVANRGKLFDKQSLLNFHNSLKLPKWHV